MSKGLSLVCAFVLLLGASAPASATEPDFSRVRVLRAGEEVLALAQTPDGLLWVGTSAGLLRFDGREFQWVDVAPGPRRAAVALLVASDGALWIGLEGAAAVVRLIGTERSAWGEREGVVPGRVRALVDDGAGGVWVGGDAGVWSIPAQGPAHRAPWTPAGLGVRALRRAIDGTLWVGTEEGLSRVRGDRLTRIWSQGPVNTLLPLGPTQLLAGITSRATNAGLYTLSLAGDTVTRAERLYSERMVRTLTITSDGVWVGTSSGLLHVNPAGSAVDRTERLGRAHAPSRVITAVLPDREGNLWMGTPLGLAEAPRPQPFYVVSPEGKRQVLSVHAGADGSVWLLGTETLLRWRDGAVREEIETTGAPDGFLGLVADDADALWVGSWLQGLFRYDGKKLAPFRLPLPPGIATDTVRPVLASRRHGLVVAIGDGGLAFWRAGALSWRSFADLGVHSEIVGAAEDQQGRVWLASAHHGLLTLDETKQGRLGKSDGLPSEDLTSVLLSSDGALWIGSRDAGLIHLAAGRFVALGRREGLGTDSIAGLVHDGRGNIWMTTAGDGVVRARESQLEDFVAGRLPRVHTTVLTARDGLPSNGSPTRSPPAGTVDARGQLWLALYRGAVVFPDPANLPAPPLPRPLIESVRIDGRALPLTGRPPHAPLGQGLLEVRYTAALFEGREHLRFRYRLDGLDRAWHDAGDGQEVVYAALGPGSYRFHVTPYFPDEPTPAIATEAELNFVLVPPFHRTRTFRALLGAFGLLAAAGAFSLRQRVLRRRRTLIAEERDRIAREIHDSLQQTLYAARLQLEAAAAGEMPASTGPNMARAAELLERGIEETRAAVWALRTGIFGRADLPVAISVTAGESLRGTDVTFALEVSGSPYRLPALTEWHIGQAVRESFTNTLKHARARSLRVHLAFEPARAVVSIVDDGTGFLADAAAPPGHYGLRGMRERLRSCGGSVTLESAPGRGTTVRLEVPRKGAAAA